LGNVEFLSSHRVRRNDDIVDEVVYVLKCMGGAAHLNAIRNAVEAKVRQDRGDPSRTLGADILQALEAYDLDNPQRQKPALFRRPFGPGSNRWAIA
jgi:hypothetical protein